MQTLGRTGISYSPDHLTDDFVKWLVEPPTQPPPELPALEAPAEPVDLESAFAAAWKEMNQDPQFVKEAQDRGYTFEQGLADFRRNQAAPLAAGLDGTVSHDLTVQYTVSREPDAFVHQLSGTPFLRIPYAVEGAALLSDRAQAVMYGVFVVIDVLSVVAAAAGVYITQAKEALQKSMQGLLHRFLSLFTTTANAQKLQRLKEAGDKLGVITKVLASLRGSVNLMDVLKAFLSEQSWWKKALMVAQFAASIALLVASAGASLAAKVVQLAASIVMLLADVTFFVVAVTS
jgi:hypothetical protein